MPAPSRRSLLGAAVLMPLALAACDAGAGGRGGQAAPPRIQAAAPAGGVLATSTNEVTTVLFDAAPVAVLAASEDPALLAPAASAAVALGLPLLTGDADSLAGPIETLGVETALVFGDLSPDGVEVVRGSADADSLSAAIGHDLTEQRTVSPEELPVALRELEPGGAILLTVADAPLPGADLDGDADRLPELSSGESSPSPVLLLAAGADAPPGPVAAARTARAEALELAHPDPRISAASVEGMTATDGTVLAVQEVFGSPEQVAERVDAARTQAQVPGGGQLVLPGKRIIALYGHPGTSALGVLGEQGVEATVERAREHAAPYEELTDDVVVPAFEIIATVASSAPGRDGQYSNVSSIEHLRPLVDAAGQNGIFAILDLQPGRTDFLTQAKLYEELLVLPHVGLALDPEWRLEPDQVHLEQIGSVEAAEVNEVSAWLAELARAHDLPQKILVLHQFRTSMIRNRQDLNTSHGELAMILHADGQGSQGAKQGTWQVLQQDLPENLHLAWKNFYDEDQPMLSPEETFAVEPTPVMVSYQ